MRSRVSIAFLILLALSIYSSDITYASEGGVLWKYQAQDIVYSVSSSQEGDLIAVGSRDSNLYLFDKAGKLIWEYDTGSTVYGVACSADASFIAAGTENNELYLFDREGKVLWKNKTKGSISSASISADGELVAAGDEKYFVYLFDKNGDQLWSYKASFEVNSVHISADGQNVIAGDKDAIVHLFNRSGELIWDKQMDYAIKAVASSADGSLIVVGSEDSKVYLLNHSGEILWQYETGDDVNAVACSTDGHIIAAGSWDKNIYLLDRDGQLLQKYPTGGEVYGIHLSSEGDTLVAGSADQSVYALDVKRAIGAYEVGQTRNYIIRGAIIALLIAGVLFFSLTKRGRDIFYARTIGPKKLLAEIWAHKISYLFLLPTIILLCTFNYYPAFSGLYHAFTEWNPGVSTHFVGLANFRKMLADKFLWVGVVNLVIIVTAGFVKVLTLPLLVAELVFHLRSRASRYWTRTLFVVPVVVPFLVGILLWRMILDPNIGLINQALSSLNLSQFTRVWLGDESTALGSIIFIGFPWIAAFPFLIYYGGLISIPTELFDAAKVDGAGGIKRFFYIDLPLLLGQIKLLLILGFIQGMQNFILILLTTGGGPGSATYVPALELYYSAMRFNKFGYAAAIATVLFIVILGGTIINMRYVKSAVEYEA